MLFCNICPASNKAESGPVEYMSYVLFFSQSTITLQWCRLDMQSRNHQLPPFLQAAECQHSLKSL
jgi:hypothetical protein